MTAAKRDASRFDCTGGAAHAGPGAAAHGSPKVVCVAGSGSGAGKTTVACMLLEHLPGWAAVKVTRCHAGRSCPHEKACGVCSSLDRPWSLREMPPDDSPQKDTGRLRAAGASRVLWLVTTEDAAREGLAEALLRLREVPGVVIEGNAAASLPSLAMLIAVRRAGQANPSPRRAAAMAAADMTINITGPGTPPTLRETCQRIADRLRRGESAPAAHSPSA